MSSSRVLVITHSQNYTYSVSSSSYRVEEPQHFLSHPALVRIISTTHPKNTSSLYSGDRHVVHTWQHEL